MSHSTKRSWPKAWDSFDAPKTEHEAITLAEECLERRSHMLSQIANMAANKASHVHNLVRRCASSHSALLGQLHIDFRKSLTLSHMDIAQLATSADLLDWCVYGDLIWIERDSGKRRPAVRFDQIARSVQRNAANALKHAGGLHDRQFLFSGGVGAACDWLCQQIREGRHIVTTDFPSFFLTVNRARLQEALPFTGQFVSKLLFDPLDHVVSATNKKSLEYDKDFETLVSMVCPGGSLPTRGVSPGNALSSIATEHELAFTLRAVEGGNAKVHLASYADNLVISAPSKATARVAVEALLSVVQTQFGTDVAGMLHQRMTHHQKGESVFWLGRHFVRIGNKVQQRINNAAKDIFVARTVAKLNTVTKTNSDAVLTHLRRSIMGWAGAHFYDPEAIATALELAELVMEHPEYGAVAHA